MYYTPIDGFRLRRFLHRGKLEVTTMSNNYDGTEDYNERTARDARNTRLARRQAIREFNRDETCKRCGVVTGPVFGLCAVCVQKEDAAGPPPRKV